MLHFADLYVCTAEHEPPLCKITAGHKQRYTSQQPQLQQQAELIQGMDPTTGTWAAALFNCRCAYWHSFDPCQLSQAMPMRVLVQGIFHNSQCWWCDLVLRGRQLTYIIASCLLSGLEKEPGAGLFAGRDTAVEARTGLLQCKIL